MGIRRTLAGAALGLAGSVLLALPAAAAAPADTPYPPAPSTGGLETSATTVTAGGSVIISGNGFAPGATITITVTVVNGFGRMQLDSTPALGSLIEAGEVRAASTVQGFAAQSVTANASGAFTATVTLTTPGTNVITASGLDPNGNLRTLSTTVVVLAAGGGVGGPGTGSGAGSGSGAGAGSGSGTGAESSGTGSASGVGGLPNTGSDLRLPLILGSVLIVVGGGAAIAGRRRKQRTAA